MNTKLTITGYKNTIPNKYYTWYINLIHKRLKLPIDPTVYSELHHIQPICIGGTNQQNNLIRLTAREHYIAHALLTKFIKGKDKFKIMAAFQFMNIKSKWTKSRYTNSKIYEQFKKQWSIEMKTKSSPFSIPMIHKKSMDTRKKNKTNIFITNNPMHNEKFIQKKVKKTSGKNHYLRKTRKYYYKSVNSKKWILIDTSSNNLSEALKKLSFSYPTFMKMLSENYKPKRGSLKNIDVKREIV